MAKTKQPLIWSSLVHIMAKHSSRDVKKHADMLLKQINTAGGTDILRNEASEFINAHPKYVVYNNPGSNNPTSNHKKRRK